MMKKSIYRVSAALLLATTLAQQPSLAHHSVAAGFEMDQEITRTGKISAMEWTNPHARMYFDVTDEEGNVETWIAWFSSSNNLFRRGWRAGDLPVGETITVNGFPARDGALQIYGGDTTLPDGRILFGGNAPGER